MYANFMHQIIVIIRNLFEKKNKNKITARCDVGVDDDFYAVENQQTMSM